MKREDIDKAASDYAEENSWYPGETSYESDIIAIEESFADAFKAGAEWRINSVWHDASEPPITGKEALVKYMTGDLKIKYRVDVFCSNEWKEMCHYDKLIQFAYIEDLIPSKED